IPLTRAGPKFFKGPSLGFLALAWRDVSRQLRLLRNKRATLILSSVLLALTLSLSITSIPHIAKPARAAQAAPPSGTYFDHIVVVIMEDHGIYDVCGDSPPPCLTAMGATYMAGLANSYAIGSQYLGVTHYSQADYMLINDLSSASAPSFMWLTPNNCDNMHGFTGTCPSSVSFGDGYLKSLIPNILSSTTFTTQRSALFVVFDEGNGFCPLNRSSEDCVYAVWAGRLAKASFGTTNLYNHYSWTRTVEVNWNLPSLTSNDGSATPMTE